MAIELVGGNKVKVNPGTTVHVWDFENCVSDTWLIDGRLAEHEFVVKSAPEDPTLEEGGSHVVLVQAGFEHEYEIRVEPDNLSEVAISPQLTSTSPARRLTPRRLADHLASITREAPRMRDELLETLRAAWSTLHSDAGGRIRARRRARLARSLAR